MQFTRQSKENLTDCPFATGSNRIGVTALINTNIQVSSDDEEIPICCLNTPVGVGFMRRGAHVEFQGRFINTDKAREILDSIWEPRIFAWGTGNTLIGKGFLGEVIDSTNFQVYMMAAIRREDDFLPGNVRLYVNKRLMPRGLATGVRSIGPLGKYLALVIEAINDCQGEVIITNNILKTIGHKISVPTFLTMEEHNEWKNKILREAMAGVKSEFVH